jgi:micrococcal nuclease
MGAEALAVNRRLVEGKQLHLVFDQEKKDRYGRYLAYVYRGDGLFVNAELVKAGYAHVLSRFPNIHQAKNLLAVQRTAMEKGRGIWGLIKQDARAAHAYLGNRGSKRFHAHNCPMTERIANKNRVWLENQWTAFWEGYSPAKECIEFP